MTALFFLSQLRYDSGISQHLDALFDFWKIQDDGFPRNSKVLLKPNMLSPHPPEASVTTHPLLVQLIASVLRDFGNDVYIADSPAGINNKSMSRLWKITGMEEAARASGAELININSRGLVERKGISRNFFFTDFLDEVDYVVNLPKLKTHGLTLITGAMKNVFGLIPGIQKGEFHVRFPNPADFSENMVEIYAAVRPHFTIMDGISILEGNGPSSGGKVRYAGYLFAGTDGVAVDALAARSLGIDPLSVEMIRFAREKQIGETDLKNISISGSPLTHIQAEIPAPHVFSRLPEFSYSLLKKLIWSRPKASPEQCTHCGICIRNCPVKAMSPDGSGLPQIDYETCIHCFCCAEVCPDDAIYQEYSWLVKLLS